MNFHALLHQFIPVSSKKGLVVVRAGDTSLHPQWINKKNHKWDLALSYYGDYPDRYLGQYDFIHIFKGQKWEGIYNFLKANKNILNNYDYIWFPDDDILTNSETIDRFFDLCRKHKFTIAQPALTSYSYYSFAITLQNPENIYRLTDFVEIMIPCFRVKTLHHFISSFAINNSGWGLEWLWNKIAMDNNLNKLAIVDSTPVYHTRPVGSAGHGGGDCNPFEEKDELLKKFNLELTEPNVIKSIKK